MKMVTFIAALLATLGAGAVALAHGINGHVWVSDSGLENLPACETELRAAFADPSIREKFQFGAAFPDSGYATSDEAREYGETAHWEPFIQAYIEYLRAKYNDDYSAPGAMTEVAFLMGDAQHGLEDEVFDSTFMRKSMEVENIDQEFLDPGTDFLLVDGGYTKLTPEVYYPEDITLVYASMGIEVDERWIKSGTRIVRDVVIGLVENPDTVAGLADEYRDDITWAAAHFLDEKTTGSHAFEVSLIAPYVAAIWHRLHGQLLPSDVIIGQAPLRGERLAGNKAASVDSWVTVFTGIGLLTRSLTKQNVQVVDAIGEPVDIEIGWVIWSGPDDDTRLVQVRPVTDWVDDAEYTVTLSANVERIDGETLGMPFEVTFHTACAEDKSCAALPVAPKPEPVCLKIAAPIQEKKSGCGIAAGAATPVQPLAALLLVGVSFVGLRRRSAGRA